jgi:1-phosphatidylinositol-3-phosphate 5-kinase
MPSSKPAVESISPTISLAPGSRDQSRRASTVSVPPPSDLDQDAILDHIHTTASRSDALTTFDDFAPPRPGSTGEGKVFAGDIVQGGLSGLYSRFKASVGAAKDAVAGSTGNDSADDASIRSAQSKAVAPKSSTTAALTSPTTASASSSRLQSPLNAKFPEQASLSSSVSLQSKAVPSSAISQLRSGLQSLETSDLANRVGSSHGDSQSPEDSRQSIALSQSAGSTSSPTTNPIRHARHADNPSEGGTRSQDAFGAVLNKTGSRAAFQSLSNSQAEPYRAERQDADAASAFTSNSGVSNDPERTPRNSAKRGERPKPLGGDSSSTIRPITRVSTKQNAPGFQDLPITSNFTSDSMAESHNANQRPPLIQVSQSHLPGFRANDSSDGDLSSVATTAVTAPRKPNYELVEEHWSRRTGSDSHLSHDTTSRMRNKILAKELWMRDENAKDCFYCGDAFSAFRRKHHCREHLLLPSCLLAAPLTLSRNLWEHI